jgi:hypothetical protein
VRLSPLGTPATGGPNVPATDDDDDDGDDDDDDDDDDVDQFVE